MRDRNGSTPTNPSQNVINLSRFMVDHRFPALASVEAYWQGLRAGRMLPRRSDIDPRGIENALEFSFILERIAPGIAKMRIAGSHLTELMGMEVRSMPASVFFSPASRNHFGDILETVFEGPAIATLNLVAERGIGKPAIDAKMLLLPVKSDFGDVSRILGCLETKGSVGRSPRRFEIHGQTVHQLTSGQGSDRFSPQKHGQPSTAVSGFAEETAQYRSTQTNKPATQHIDPKSYLKLVKAET